MGLAGKRGGGFRVGTERDRVKAICVPRAGNHRERGKKGTNGGSTTRHHDTPGGTPSKRRGGDQGKPSNPELYDKSQRLKKGKKKEKKGKGRIEKNWGGGEIWKLDGKRTLGGVSKVAPGRFCSCRGAKQKGGERGINLDTKENRRKLGTIVYIRGRKRGKQSQLCQRKPGGDKDQFQKEQPTGRVWARGQGGGWEWGGEGERKTKFSEKKGGELKKSFAD